MYDIQKNVMSSDEKRLAALLKARQQWQKDEQARREYEETQHREYVQQSHFLHATESLVEDFKNWCEENDAKELAGKLMDIQQEDNKFFEENVSSGKPAIQISHKYFNRLSLLNQIISKEDSLELFKTYLSGHNVDYDSFLSDTKTLKDVLLDVAQAFNDKRHESGFSNQ
ncbi:Uncharacterised protein [Legionella spiritensis]|nr:Uncharacterised protein [Legionella spiritensis]